MNIEFVPNEKDFLKVRENGVLLSDNEIDILKKNNINYQEFKDLRSILFALNELNDCEEDEEIENLALILDERCYYSKKD